MKEIGKLLKEKRRKMNISLTDVQEVTKIQEKYISAIEDGDMSVFFAEVYYKSFVRSYAEYLGFDPEELLKKLDIRKRQMSVEKEHSTNADGKLNKETSLKSKISAKKLLMIVFAIVTAFFVLFLYLSKNVSSVRPSVETPLRIKTSNNREQTGVIAPAVGENKEISSSARQKLLIEAVRTVWIKINSDDKMVFEGTIAEGGKNSWEADKSFTLKVGYAPGVKVFFNGEQVDVVSGSVQDVNTVILEKRRQ
ncbi:helix-turn-helix domain-containing protein [Candidatus Endomicrobiellum agilis]|uniref:helix-turn-helix domain-containing protein n=1 Tax=Candidatus Endomicrobiellum agilis TaxID=3238957 RepID=UPI003588F3C6|nr:DUF4115 domain-containing protein [Endomicrobium sp.]